MVIENTNQKDLIEYVCTQLNHFYPDRHPVQINEIKSSFNIALDRVEYCFSKINNKYFFQDGQTVFNYLNSDQYSMFLYFLSNSAYKSNLDKSVCNKIFLLNKCLFGVDAFYEVELPDIFIFVHPISTVLGRASYSNYFVVYQSCNIGANHGVYPTLMEHVTLHPASSVLGNCVVGKNCDIGAGSLLLDKNIDDNKVYVGMPGDYKILDQKASKNIWM